MIQFSIGVSALQAAQQGLAVAGNNLANASTPGYHRQIAHTSALGSTQYNGQSVGTGVELSEISRAVNNQLDVALAQQYSSNSYVDASISSGSQIEQTITSNGGSPSSQVEALLNQLQSLSSNPTDGPKLQATVSSAQAVASAFNLASDNLSQIRSGLDQSIQSSIKQINVDTKQIASLNNQIAILKSQGINANDLEDNRSQLINSLSSLIGTRAQIGDDGQVSVFAAGTQIVSGNSSVDLAATNDSSGLTQVTGVGSDQPLTIDGGELGGYLDQRNGSLADYQQRFDEIARQVILSFNAIQTTGVGAGGGFTNLSSTNAVSSTTASLNAAGLTFPPGRGSLYVGVTDLSTGQRKISQVTINPQTQSLQDIANAINSSAPKVQAMVNSQTGTLSLTAFSGYSFDFTGGIEVSPTTSFTAATTAVPTLSGAYTGDSNDQYKVTFLSSGSVGITSNLKAQVTDQSGNVLATVNIGEEYRVGQPIALANGIKLTLDSGDVAAGDSFSTPTISNSDTAGVLNSLGMNTMFSGSDAASIKLNGDIANDPSRLATSRTGDSGDTSNLLRFSSLADVSLMNGGTQTLSEYAQQMVSDIGIEVQALNQQQSTNKTLTTNLTNQQQAVSGVDTNEELTKILQYQQMFSAAGKYISTVNDTLSQLLDLIR